MEHRNMSYASQMIDLEIDQQGHGHLQPDPRFLYGSITNFPPPNIHPVLPAPVNTPNFDVHRQMEHHNSALFYGMTQYNGVQHHQPPTGLDLAVAAASNHYTPYMTPPSGNRVLPPLLNHGSHDQFPFVSSHGSYGVSGYGYGRNSHIVDDVRNSFKGKNAEGIPGNFQYCSNASAGSSSAVAPMRARFPESDDAAPFVLPEYGGNDMPLGIEVGSHRSERNRSGAICRDSVMAQNTNHIAQGNYLGQPFPTAGTPWLDPQFSRNGGDIGTFHWNQAPASPYMHGSITEGCMEAGNMGVQGYQVRASNIRSTSFQHPPPIPQGHSHHHHHHHPPPPMQGVRGQNVDFHSHVPTSSRRLSTNSPSHASMNPFQDGVEVGPRFLGPVPPRGHRIYWPHGREAMPEADLLQHNLPHLRLLPEDGVAMLEIPGYHEVGDFVDHYRDMRLDIDHMSYEELLALGDQIGSVRTGLLEDNIVSYLKTRTFVSTTTGSNREEAANVDQENNVCVICQVNFEDQEKIGSLDCGHEYHVDCIKKWLLVKNTCPICKSSALTTGRKDQ